MPGGAAPAPAPLAQSPFPGLRHPEQDFDCSASIPLSGLLFSEFLFSAASILLPEQDFDCSASIPLSGLLFSEFLFSAASILLIL